jgi:hypothetical protein
MPHIHARQKMIADKLAPDSNVEYPARVAVQVSGDAQDSDRITVQSDHISSACPAQSGQIARRFVERHQVVDAPNFFKTGFNRSVMAGRNADFDNRSKPRPCAADQGVGMTHCLGITTRLHRLREGGAHLR